MIQQKFQTRKFDQSDTTFLRALMRRYGWARRARANAACCWFQTFSEVRKAEDWSEFAWFLVTELLHPLASVGMRDLHNPIAVSEARSSEQGIDAVAVKLREDLLDWQTLEGRAVCPPHRRMQPWPLCHQEGAGNEKGSSAGLRAVVCSCT